MSRAVEPIVMDVHLPAGIAGPEPLEFDIRCFLVSHATGLVLIDTGMAGSRDAVGAGLDRVGAGWGDITDIILTHGHADHVGGLVDVAASAARARVWAGLGDHGSIPYDGLERLVDGEMVRDLRVVQTPGHTPGHCSLVLDERSILFAGDVVGSMAGSLSRGPATFTADAEQAERSIRRVSGFDVDRVLFGHGGEIPDPIAELRKLVGGLDRAASGG